MYWKGKDIRKKRDLAAFVFVPSVFLGEVFNSWILSDIGRNFLLGNRKKIANCLKRTFTCRSTFLYATHGWYSYCNVCTLYSAVPWRVEAGRVPEREAVSDLNGGCSGGEGWGGAWMHCKDKIPKFRNKYSQKRNIEVSAFSPNFHIHASAEWFMYIFLRSFCQFSWSKYVDRFWDYINRSQTHECWNWGWGRAIPRKGIHKWDFRSSMVFQKASRGLPRYKHCKWRAGENPK